MGLAGTIKSFDKKFKFRVEIDGFKAAEFSKCSKLEAEIDEISHNPGGGSVIPNKSPGMVKFTDITLERGVTSDTDCFVWFNTVVALAAAGVGASNVGLVDPIYKRNIDIVQLDRDGAELKRWTLFGAWPKKFSGGEWDASANEVVTEELVICFDFFDKTL